MFVDKRLPEPTWLKHIRKERDDLYTDYDSCSDSEQEQCDVQDCHVPSDEEIVYNEGNISQLDGTARGRKARKSQKK